MGEVRLDLILAVFCFFLYLYCIQAAIFFSAEYFSFHKAFTLRNNYVLFTRPLFFSIFYWLVSTWVLDTTVAKLWRLF